MLQSFIFVSKVLYKNCCCDHSTNNFRNIDQLYKNYINLKCILLKKYIV